MPWTETARRRYCRDELRYASNLTDAEWALITPLMPAPAPRGRLCSVSPTAGVIDSQPVKTTEAGAPAVLKSIRARDPRLRHVFADGGYAGPKLKGRLEKIGKWTIQIVKCSGTAEGFELLPRRWVVERTFAWLRRCRRLAKDFEATIASATAWVLLAHIRLRTRKIIRQR